jgi:hypothetical protein
MPDGAGSLESDRRNEAETESEESDSGRLLLFHLNPISLRYVLTSAIQFLS